MNRRYAMLIGGCLAAFALLAVAILLTSPRPERAFIAAEVLALGLVLTVIVFRPGPRRAIAALVVFCGLALIEAVRAPEGVAEAVFLPLLAGIVLVPSFRGRRLVGGFVFAWLASVAGVSLAFTMGSAATLTGQTYPPTSIAYVAITSALAFATLWWVADRWRAALGEADTERQLAEERERRFRMLFDEATDALLIIREDLSVVDANPAFRSLLGYSTEDLGTLSYADLVEPQVLPEVRANVVRLREGEDVLVERRLRTKDGLARTVEVCARHLADGNLQLSMRDLTARRIAEAEQQRLATAVEQAGDTIAVDDADGIIVYVNPAFERITGYAASEAIGHTVAGLLRSGAHPAAFYDELDAASREGRPWAGRIVNRRGDGTTYEQDLRLSPLRDADGRIVGSVEVGRDMTRELALEDQLRQANKMEAIGHLAGGVAHDFNNILTAIRGYADLVRRGLPEERSRDRADLGEVILAADRATALTKQLLAFARQAVLEPRILDPGEVVSEFAPMLRRLLGEHIELVLRTAAGSSRIKVDPGQLGQVVLNLAVNARDAMPEGGQLQIRTSEVALDAAFVERHPQARTGSFVVLSVSDNGKGMDEEVRRRIFEPFFTTKDPGKGTGLGLATVFGIVTMSDGWIDVQSAPGQGTTFSLYFPRLSDPAASAGHDERPDAVPRGSETVLFVEDDAAVRSFGRRCLLDLGYSVLEASSGADALSLAGAYPGRIDLLMSDVVMPGLQGPEVAERLRELRPGIRIVFSSGFTGSTTLGADGSSDGFLPKPYTRETLAREVRRVLDRAE
jgi:PAS domain S-box-containing protein